MQPYQNLSGDSGVVAYETGRDFIRVQFVDGGTYVYDYEIPGVYHVERMKELATSGQGLSGYISRHVRQLYASKA